MDQYVTMRRSLPDDIVLFFRLGDFYEMFFDDAKRAAEVLNVALTKRHDIPMCGVPHHAAQGYIAKLIQHGTRVAIAEQTSVPVAGKLVDREISQIISAGTVNDINLLDDSKNNYLVSIYKDHKKWGLACADHTTGEFNVSEFSSQDALHDEIHRLKPSELIIADDQLSTFGNIDNALPYDGYAFIHDQAHHTLCDHFSVNTLNGFGCEDMPSAVSAAGAILHYLSHQLRRSCTHLTSLKVRESYDFVLIDSASQRNLDLVDSRSGKKHTLIGALDNTSTPMGARLLRDWVLHPLKDLAPLLERQEMIATLIDEAYVLAKSRESLKGIKDIERTTGRLAQKAGNARDLVSLSLSLEKLPRLKDDISAITSRSTLATTLLEDIDCFEELVTLLQSALVDEPPANLKEGGILRDGYNSDLDELRRASSDGKSWIAKLQQTERERTGIDNLKIKFNNVFGYFLEVSKGKVDMVPDDFQRKQTMANAERYITPELKEIESKVLGADERSKQLEHEAFLDLREAVCKFIPELQRTSKALATIDVILGLAETAQLHAHVRPLIDESHHLEINNGRHPVLEQTLLDEKFVPNDTLLDHDSARLAILTGPNMAGKSTYIRQVALITLMAQIGAFVPADSAHIGIVDRIFCRVGASDDLTKGQSTFMVEMNETSLIINNASVNSLVILDEIGRGTATFDGLSIAWSVAEYLHDEIKARTLFATHYHELTDLARTRDSVKNFNVAVREWNDEIIFLRKILEGTADKSYGIQVARLAGLPKPIIDRAKDILSPLEMNASKPDSSATENQKPKLPNKKKTMPEANSPQMDLF